MWNFRQARKKNNVPESDGPDPKMNFRPAEKRPNAAELFKTENQGPSDTLHCQSTDCLKSVRRHNRDYPRLEDELHKKDSLVKVTTIKAKDLHREFSWNCEACAKLMTYNYLKKKLPRPRCEAKYNSSSMIKSSIQEKPIEKLKGVKKHKRSSVIQTHRSCQCSITLIKHKASKSTGYESNTPALGVAVEDEACCANKRVNAEDPSNSDDEKQRPNKKHPSLSSYNSYGSMDHEPMDS